VINEIRFQLTVSDLKEEGLPVVGVFRANVDHPCQPEVGPVTDAKETVARQDFQERFVFPAKELRTETQARSRSKAAIRCLEPKARIFVEQGFGDHERPPVGTGKFAGAIKLASQAFVEGKVWSFEIVHEFDDVQESVARLSQGRL
jgi:hypothetical protein